MDKLVEAINIIADKYNVTPGDSIEDTILDVAKVLDPSSGGGEGGGLPDPSEANVGDVLTVVENGEAAWMPALKTIRAIAPEESLVYTMDTLYTDIVSFYEAGIPMCVAIGRIFGGSFVCEQFFFITYLSTNDGEIYAMGSTGGQPFNAIFVNSQSGYPKYDALG